MIALVKKLKNINLPFMKSHLFFFLAWFAFVIPSATAIETEMQDWNDVDKQALKSSARVIEIFKQDLEFVQSLGRVMGRAPEYSNRSAAKAEEKVINDIAASYYDALTQYSSVASKFLIHLVADLKQIEISKSLEVDSTIWLVPSGKEPEYSVLRGITDVLAAGAAVGGAASDNIALTSGAVAGANLVDFITELPGYDKNLQVNAVDVERDESGKLIGVGEYAKKINDLSVQVAMSRLLYDDSRVQLLLFENMIDDYDASAQKLSDLISILNYGTNEAAYAAIKELIEEGKWIAKLSRKLADEAEKMHLRTNHYAQNSHAYLLPSLAKCLPEISEKSNKISRILNQNEAIFELIVDTSKNVEIVQFYLQKQ
ncbi:hypothetical protein Ctha_2361 [Chloroherpeton thalassium ATCC 35110]|uniref:Uncharacterized protein n=1 Tax=Chloroherpeton thalassium (strain ATCC 35110 / GB-78) TaxID=517418 RepID=B3QWQ1_CHLT3|nr:hypothetical protein [Chloroherpeton thalassium]ACF14811.1 hypothetical protein Ctha_2361 [Chloroherpeton thalassium ATCC 35110]